MRGSDLVAAVRGFALADRATANARQLREDQTPQEAKLWNVLRDRRLENVKFRRQMPIGRYIADFASVSLKLIVELDGAQHGGQAERDAARTQAIEAFGYRVVRIWNNDVDRNLEGVVDALREDIRIAKGQ